MSKLWTLPVGAMYLYAITILTQYGYLSYFGIPYNFIQISLVDNTIFAHALYGIILAFIGLIPWWGWITGVILLIFLLFKIRNFHKVLIGVVTLLLILFLIKAVNFGNFIAKSETNFLIPSSECGLSDKEKTYIIPTFYGGKAILISINENSKKMDDGFLTKDISDLSCKLEHREIGKVIK